MRIVVLNGSPRKNGNTEIMVDAFCEGAKENNHDVRKVNLGTKKIAPCIDCKYCFTHGGACSQKDDMGEIMDALSGADMVVFASPIYWFTVSAQLKTAIDRMYALAGTKVTIKYAAMLLDAGSSGVFRSAVAMYEDTCSYLKWQDKGILTVPDMDKKGAMADSEGREQAYLLGKGLT